jgi:hypothetical protein
MVKRGRVALRPGLIKVQDPNGVVNELCWGPLMEAEDSFRSPRRISGFEAGALGFGRIALAVDDYDTSLWGHRSQTATPTLDVHR